MSLKTEALSGIRWTAMATALATGLQTVQFVVVARWLGPTEIGLAGLVMVVVGFGQAFADMGLSNALVQAQDATHEQLSSLYWLNMLAGGAIALSALALSPLLAAFFHEPRLEALLAVSAAIFVVTPLGQPYQSLMQKGLRFDALAKIEVASALLGSAIAVGLAIAGAGVWALVWAMLAAATLRAVLLVAVGARAWRPALRCRIGEVPAFVRFGLYQMGERAINYFNARADQLLIGALLGPTVLGYYSMAFAIAVLPMGKLNPILTNVAFPVFSRVQDDAARLRDGYMALLRAVSLLNFPLLVGLAAVAPTLLPLVLGAAWLPAVPVVQVLAAIAVLRASLNPLGSLMLAKGQARMGFWWNLGILFTQLPGLYLGARLGGLAGAMVALVVLQTVYSAAAYALLVRPLLGPCFERYVRSMAAPLGSALAMGVAVCGAETALRAHKTLVLLAGEIALGAGCFVLLAALFLREDLREAAGLVFKAERRA